MKLIITKQKLTTALFIGLLIFATPSCSLKGYVPVTNDTKPTNIQIFNSDFEKLLYKTNIKIYSKLLTGITIIKQDNNTIRVVSMSEMGMKYFDIEFSLTGNKEASVHYVMEPLNKKLLVNLIINDFKLLFYQPTINDAEIMVSEHNENVFAIKHNKLWYLADEFGYVDVIAKKNQLLNNKKIVAIKYNSKLQPSNINIEHNNISFNFAEIK